MKQQPPRVPIGVTDHALVRWLERTGAMDVETMRALLAASLDRAVAAASVLDARNFLILVDGLVYVVRDDKVITVIEDDGRHAAHLLPERDKP